MTPREYIDKSYVSEDDILNIGERQIEEIRDLMNVKKKPIVTDETRKKMRKAQKKRWTKEAREKVAKISRGY